MFDKIKKILGIEEKQEEPKEAEVNFNEILSFIKQETKDKKVGAKNKINKELNEILSEFEKLEEKLLALKKSKPEAQIPPGRKFDFKIRDRFCDNTIASIKKLEKPKVNHKAVSNFLNDCENVFKNFDDISPKSSAWLMFLFQEKMKELGVVVKNIQNQVKELHEFMDFDGRILKIETKIKSMIRDVERNKKEILTNKKKLKETEEKIKNLIEKINTKKEKLTQLKNSKEFSELNALKNKIEKKKQEALQIEEHINAVFAPAHRIMKKFRYIDSGLDKEFTKHLDSYLGAPAETYINERYDGAQNIHKILSRINNAIEKKDITVSKRGYNKWVEIMNLCEGGDLVKYKENYLKIQKMIEQEERVYEKNKKPVREKKDKIEKELVKMKNSLFELQKQEKDLKSERDKIKSKLVNSENILKSAVNSAVEPMKVRII